MSLDIRSLSVIYRDGDHGIQALEDVTLEIRAGECFALVGESGSGKSANREQRHPESLSFADHS